jgi:hypothetical protein
MDSLLLEVFEKDKRDILAYTLWDVPLDSGGAALVILRVTTAREKGLCRNPPHRPPS